MEKIKIFGIIKTAFQKIKENWLSCLVLYVAYSASDYNSQKIITDYSKIFDSYGYNNPQPLSHQIVGVINDFSPAIFSINNAIVTILFVILSFAFLFAIHNKINLLQATLRIIPRIGSVLLIWIVLILFSLATFLAVAGTYFIAGFMTEIFLIKYFLAAAMVVYAYYLFIRFFAFSYKICLLEEVNFSESIGRNKLYTKGLVGQLTWKYFLLHLVIAIAFMLMEYVFTGHVRRYDRAEISMVATLIKGFELTLIVVVNYVFYVCYRNRYQQMNRPAQPSIREQILGY